MRPSAPLKTALFINQSGKVLLGMTPCKLRLETPFYRTKLKVLSYVSLGPLQVVRQ